MKLCPGHERLSSDYSDWKCGANCPFCGGVCAKCFPPKPAIPAPSITVGTQVRLTGVVQGPTRKLDDAQGVLIHGSANEEGIRTLVFVKPEYLEVIRQPFKRGEVVYFEDDDIACVVLEDEQNGRMLLIEAGEGKYATYVDADLYERRPSRPKEER